MKHPGLTTLLKIQAESRVQLMSLYRDWVVLEFKGDSSLFVNNPILLDVAIKEQDSIFSLVTLPPGENLDWFYMNRLDDIISFRDHGAAGVEFHWDLHEERGQTNYSITGQAKPVYFRKRINTTPEQKNQIAKLALKDIQSRLNGENPEDQIDKKKIC